MLAGGSFQNEVELGWAGLTLQTPKHPCLLSFPTPKGWDLAVTLPLYSEKINPFL
jgi:hypothetical protein